MPEGYFIIICLHVFISFCLFKASIKEMTSKNKLLTRAFVLFAYFVYIFISTFRLINTDYTNGDAYSYKWIFDNANMSYRNFLVFRREEFGYKTIVWIVRNFTDDYKVMLFIFHTFIYWCTVYFVKKMKPKKQVNVIVYFLCIFLVVGNLFHAFNLLRSSIAVSCSYVLIISLQEQKIKKAWLFFILGMLFHNSMIIMSLPIVAYMVVLHKYNRSNRMIIVGCIVIVEFVCMTFLSNYMFAIYSIYNNSQGLAIGAYVAILFLLYYFMKKGNTLNDDERIANMILEFSLCCVPINFFYSIAYRMVLLFMPLVYSSIMKLTSEDLFISNLSIRFQKKHAVILMILIAYLLYETYQMVSIDEITWVGNFAV